MLTHYETKRLNLDILTPDYCKEVLHFYERNKALFQPYDPKTPASYYTETYQYHSLSCEYALFLRQERVRFYLTLKEQPNNIIGTISFSEMQRGYTLSAIAGYKLDGAFQHQGYAFEALQKGISILFHEEQFHRITAYIMPDNTASIRLIERLHFSFEGIAKQYARIQDRWQDHLQYALINTD